MLVTLKWWRLRFVFADFSTASFLFPNYHKKNQWSVRENLVLTEVSYQCYCYPWCQSQISSYNFSVYASSHLNFVIVFIPDDLFLMKSFVQSLKSIFWPPLGESMNSAATWWLKMWFLSDQMYPLIGLLSVFTLHSLSMLRCQNVCCNRLTSCKVRKRVYVMRRCRVYQRWKSNWFYAKSTASMILSWFGVILALTIPSVVSKNSYCMCPSFVAIF